MENSVAVGILERIGDGRAQLEGGFQRYWARREPVLEAPARHVLHDQEVVIVLGIEVEDRGHTGVGETGQHPRLAPEPLPGRRIGQCPAGEHLDGDHPVQLGVVCLPHLAHPALADRLDELVPAEYGAGPDGGAVPSR